ncbi:GNAT family N-acetyltransferase [Aquimarina sp. AU474]|uniref:GNAT family N-acetyltransferase n=1 Tax=Aquimarina sp. AU474 TaxID=2108529 RepID=UPI000D68E2CD|nr:GNAT family N-acetyltransferase [Aquimarina sp. AU474]
MSTNEYLIRDATSDEFSMIGLLMVNVYSQLEGFPNQDQQPEYYSFLTNIGNLTQNPKTRLLIAISENGQIGGGVVYFGDMTHYGSGGTATKEKNAAGFRLLAVDPATRGKGIGKLLTNKCIELAKEEKQNQVIIHSTKAMQIAWKMYEKLGFIRAKDLDFVQRELPVYGFRLKI